MRPEDLPYLPLLILIFSFNVCFASGTNVSYEYPNTCLETISSDTTLFHPNFTQIESIKGNKTIRKQVVKWQSERIIRLGPDTFNDKFKVLYIVNGKKIKDDYINQLSTKQIKSIRMLKHNDIPKRFKRKGVTGLIKIKTRRRIK